MKRFAVAGLSLVSVVGLAAAVVLLVEARSARAHCQVPCGIYDDAARISRMKEDATTIGKAIDSIRTQSGEHNAKAINQMIRWVTTKEDHATHIIDVVSEYFLTQKVKPVDPGTDGYEAYLKSLADHHAVMVAAMKCKQDADPATVDALNKAIDTLAAHYKP